MKTKIKKWNTSKLPAATDRPFKKVVFMSVLLHLQQHKHVQTESCNSQIAPISISTPKANTKMTRNRATSTFPISEALQTPITCNP
ncbi:hypothetical protein HYC85_012222 [Camellia sinensis]|uniref:Uncharacterized protein n=1 Tax=Camellia sinensis TaxID=4442 RepID=A0A7J7HBX2_CAMSI|nr:hypothetical protein HYC85_012222 [Camellia sinensis]